MEQRVLEVNYCYRKVVRAINKGLNYQSYSKPKIITHFGGTVTPGVTYLWSWSCGLIVKSTDWNMIHYPEHKIYHYRNISNIIL